ncbi:MAG: sugar transferase [Planctomycetota bacterium]|jgi:lipopolysaccharide/colanic/teichoic acid biosynthesis glycosyltransferase
MDIGLPLRSRTLWARGGKRIFDLAGGLALVLLCGPILAAAALAIKLTSRGPLLFRHTRTGHRGVEFRPYKFRTMLHGRTDDAVELIPLNHPEITRVGQLLRRIKLDELPQILNVVKGEMSLIGPRPDLPEHVAKYTPFKRQRLAVRPGLTGLAQINGAADITWDERIRYDVHYIAHCSLWLDLTILFRTLGIIIHGEGHYARKFEDSPYYDPNELLGWDEHLRAVDAGEQQSESP